MQIIQNRRVFDVCVIGSGAGGGMAAKVLTEAGANVVMLEAGPMWDPVADSKMFAWPYDTPRRGAAIPERHFGEFDAALGGWTLEGEPYTNAPGDTWEWFRSRMIGGRTNHWGRISLRFGPYDFKRRTMDGLGDDWPITYDDLKPYYDKVDRLIGIFGSEENLPNEPNGIFLPPPRPRCYELLIKQASEKLNIPVIPSRLSILTRPHNGRAACHYCGQCGRGCRTHSNFSSPSVLLPPAMATGRLTIITGAMAREVTVDASGLADGVTYVDTRTSRDNRVRARIVVLAASACESARLLLNSKSPRHPNGLANGSGAVGRYLTDTPGTSIRGYVPALAGLPAHNDDGTGGLHLYMPWWLDNRKLDFPRGYHFEFGGGREMPGYGIMGGIHRANGGGYGRKLKDDYRRYYGSFLSFAARGEMLPNADSYCELDPEAVDRFGIPVLKFHWKWAEAETLQMRHAHLVAREIIDRMGGKVLGTMPTREHAYGIQPGGEIIHEAGTTRMGESPATSVLNRNGQAHEVKNLFVADAGPFVTNPHKNATWTIMALAWRTADFIAAESRKGNL
jgi:choline dehydrogenase-like flavoprotein